MRPIRTLVPSLAVVVVSLLFTAVAQAGSTGGAQSPSAPLSGGSEYGLSSAVPHPVVSTLSVPSNSTPGRPPHLSLRIDEQHVGTVDATVAINNLSTRKQALVVHLGWVRTGRVLNVAWPHGAMLGVGTYHVSVSAHDRYNHNLTRLAHSSGVATLTVAAPAPAVVPTPLPPAAPAIEAGVPTPAQTVADGAIFPVAGEHNFGGPENRYGAPRGNHVHEGQDILTTEGTPDVAPLAGTISYTSYHASGAGYYAVEHTAIGFDLVFDHCKAASLVVAVGQAVSPGTQLCQAGQTGDATTPHLHFEMWVGGWYAPGGHTIDPLPYLQAWEAVGK
jgi:hypothetical protein